MLAFKTQKQLLFILQSLPSIKIQIPTPNKQQEQITTNKRRKNPQIPPTVIKTNQQRLKELIANFKRTVLTDIRHVVSDISRAAILKERRHVFATVLVSGGREGVVFEGLADDGLVVEFGDDHGGDETGEGVEFVEPGAPEFGDLGFGDGDAAEEGEDDDDERIQKAGDEGGGRQGGDHLADCDGEEFGDEDDEELEAGAIGGWVEVGEVVDWEEEEEGAEEGVWHFRLYHGEGEGELFVRFGCRFAVEDQPRHVVHRFDLGEDESWDDGNLEDDKDTILQT